MTPRNKLTWTGIGLFIFIVGGVGCYILCGPEPRLIQFTQANGDDNQSFTYTDLDNALGTYVDGSGMVDYKELKADRKKLDSFSASLGTLSAEIYENEWDEKAKIAFWINAYNALTLEAIIEHYPIKSSVIASLTYPKNSLRQIPGVWDKLEFKVMGKKRTLDNIEHDELRAKFNEPRIHVALVCAAMGCPPLRNESFTGKKLDTQLDDQVKRFLVDSKKFKIDRKSNVVYLSSIFKWFGESKQDFLKTYGTKEKFKDHSAARRSILNFVSKYVNDEDKKYLEDKKYTIKYLDYDWTLNEQK